MLDLRERNDTIISGFLEKFSKTKKPIEVSFKGLLPELSKIDRQTHLIHSYPAKLLAHIPHVFINNSILSKENDFVLDPFCGTGTVLLESIIHKRKALGADANPLARLIAKVKTKKLKTSDLEIELKKILKNSRAYKKVILPDFPNRDYWFSAKTQIQLAKILKAILKVKKRDIREFYLVCFSNCVRKVSYADPRVSVPVKINKNRYKKSDKRHAEIEKRFRELQSIDVFLKFETICKENIKRIGSLKSNVAKATLVSHDARNLSSTKNVKTNSVQLIITSPPYAGAQKYIRASSLSLGWLGIAKNGEMKKLEDKSIGRESFLRIDQKIIETGIPEADRLIKEIFKINPTRSTIVSTYINEMKEALKEAHRVLKKGGYLVLIIGNNKVCNKEFNTQKYFTYFLQGLGLDLQFKLIDDIKSYGLMTKRNKTADIISREWILAFKKK